MLCEIAIVTDSLWTVKATKSAAETNKFHRIFLEPGVLWV